MILREHLLHLQEASLLDITDQACGMFSLSEVLELLVLLFAVM